MPCDHCGDCYELLTDIRVLNALSNLLGGGWMGSEVRMNPNERDILADWPKPPIPFERPGEISPLVTSGLHR